MQAAWRWLCDPRHGIQLKVSVYFFAGGRLRQRTVATHPAALDLGDDVADFQCQTQLQAHVFHRDVRLQQQQSLAVDLVFLKKFGILSECDVMVRDVQYDVIDAPGAGVCREECGAGGRLRGGRGRLLNFVGHCGWGRAEPKTQHG